MKRAWAVLLVTLVVVLPARLYAAFNLVDAKTGFYTDGGRFVEAVAAVTAVGVIVVMVFGRKNAMQGQRTPLRSASVAVFAALSGVFIVGESLATLVSPGGLTVMNGIITALGVCAAASFLAAAYDFAAGETILRQHPLVALLAPVWGCLCLISLFISYGGTMNRFENVYHTFTVAFLLLFLFSQAKLLSGVDEENGGKMIFAYGFAAVIVALTDAVPNLGLLFAGRDTLGFFPTGLFLTNALLVVYILVYLAAEGRRRVSAPMVSIAPNIEGSNTPAAEENQPPVKPDAEDPEKSATDPMPMVLDFLQKAYPVEDKFVEKGKHQPIAAESIKS